MSISYAAASKRGAYGVIYRGILASRKFSMLTPKGKLAFYTLKLRLGFAQIDRQGSWPIELADLTGLSEADALAAIHELCAADIARFDGKVLWILDGLRWDPSMAGNVSPTVAQGIQRHIAGLPTCPITDEFRRHYPEIFGMPTVAVRTPLPRTRRTTGTHKGLDVDVVGVVVPDGDVATEKARASHRPRGRSAKAAAEKKGAVPRKSLTDALDLTGDAFQGRAGAIRLAYPRRAGGHDWGRAEKHQASLIGAGECNWPNFVLAAERYAAHCAQKDITGSEYVKDAGNFFSPGGLWESFAEPEDESSLPSDGEARARRREAELLLASGEF
ncbi:hypothetical protein [Gemmatimonas sp.]|uniref:hypothetical protein n=1 Tax=Gemmatimonas sp. TaxID=1962908 RepID=UPI003F6E6BFC